MEGYKRKPGSNAVHREFWEVQDSSKMKDEKKGKNSAKKKTARGTLKRYTGG